MFKGLKIKFHKGHDITIETTKFIFVLGKCFLDPKHRFGYIIYWLSSDKKPTIVKF